MSKPFDGATSCTPGGQHDTLTFDKLMRTMDVLRDIGPAHETLFAIARDGKAKRMLDASEECAGGGRIGIAGYRTIEIPPEMARRPVLQVSPDFPHCSPEFRKEWNAWALERFGTEEVCYMMSSEALSRIRANIDRGIADVLRGINRRGVAQVIT